MFCHCSLLDDAVASWKNFSCVFCFMSLLFVSKLGDVCFGVCLRGVHSDLCTSPCSSGESF